MGTFECFCHHVCFPKNNLQPTLNLHTSWNPVIGIATAQIWSSIATILANRSQSISSQEIKEKELIQKC
jgi:hypothetical protein